MTLVAAATPLLALDAVVLDTETTGLDSSKARILQIGAVRLVRGALSDARFEALVDPGEAIPPETSRIHGIDAARLAGAPRFADVADALDAFVGGRVVVGHNIGFDLAMLKREHALAGRPWKEPSALCTRLLAEICFPRLAGFSLDQLATHLALDAGDRHDAASDARVTGEVLLRLVGPLREKGVRTLGEAQEACRRSTAALEQYARAGWIEPRAVRGEGGLARIDAYPFQHRVRDLMSRDPVVVAGSTPLAAAIATMAERRISSLFVAEDAAERAADRLGVVTERDVLRLLAAEGAAALGRELGPLASRPLATVEADDFVYRALGRMDRLKIRHLAVEDEARRVVGALSARDLLRSRVREAIALGDAIDEAADVASLAAAWGGMPAAARRLRDEGVPGREVAAVVSREIAAATRRAAQLAAERCEAEGFGPAPAPFAVLVLGSAGRGESLLAPDQDNALVFADTPDEAEVDRWFARLGEHMAAILDAAGIPLCKGGVMAKNPAFRGSLATWRARVAGWVGRTRPEDLLAVDIFYDFDCVAGDRALAQALRDDAGAVARADRPLVKLLAEQIGEYRPPLGLLGGLKAESDGRVDLKKGGLFPIVAASRCLALRHGVEARSTPGRIAALRAKKIGSDQDLEQFARTHALVVETLLDQQLADIAAGEPPSNRVAIAQLSKSRARELARALAGLSVVGTVVRDLLF